MDIVVNVINPRASAGEPSTRAGAGIEPDAYPPFIVPNSIGHQLRQAFDRGEFVLHYQDKIDARTLEVSNMEALLRWQQPGGIVPPAGFITQLEHSGLIVDVGTWVLRQAVDDQRAWGAADRAVPRVAVNVSAVQLREADFVQRVRDAVRGNGIAPIDIEVTESILLEDMDGSIAKLRALRDLGIGVAIDDFGVGYSSLSYLARLPVDALKIDQSFVASMLQDRTHATIVRSIVSLAHSLRLKVIAEGVETPEQARVLTSLGVDQLQGYYFGRPLDAREIESRMQAV